MDLGLRDRVYVVTGGSRGLGLASAGTLVDEGARVVLCARDEAAVSAAAEGLGGPDQAIAVPGDLADDGGALAFVLSLSVREPLGNLASSNGLRPGLGMLAKTMADELGSRGVRVVGLLPGRIDTDRVRELDQASGRPKRSREEYERRIPLGRYGEPAEFGRVAAFVLSPAASYLTGVMVPVDGGLARGL